MIETKIRFIPSPLGTIELRERNGFLTELNFREKDAGGKRDSSPVLSVCEKQMGEYFAGTRTVFDVPLSLEGTVFQRDVWDALGMVPFGQTATYSEIARKIGRPAAVRAVGAANGANPVSIIVPCHRIVGADGTLTGYGGGLWRKKWLLEHEQKTIGRLILQYS